MAEKKSTFIVRTDAVVVAKSGTAFYGQEVKLSDEEAKPLLTEGKVSKESVSLATCAGSSTHRHGIIAGGRGGSAFRYPAVSRARRSWTCITTARFLPGGQAPT